MALEFTTAFKAIGFLECIAILARFLLGWFAILVKCCNYSAKLVASGCRCEFIRNWPNKFGPTMWV